MGCDIEIKDKFGKTPLMAAAKNGKLGTVKALIEQRVKMNVKDPLGDDAIRLA